MNTETAIKENTLHYIVCIILVLCLVFAYHKALIKVETIAEQNASQTTGENH